MRTNLKRLLGVLLALTLLLSLVPVAFAEGAPSKAVDSADITPEKGNTRDDDPEFEPVVGFYFEEEDALDDWTLVNNGDEGTSWILSGDNEGGYDYTDYAYEGEGFMMSFSYVDYVGAYEADNWAISPAVEVPTDWATLNFAATNANNSYPDTFSVLVGTTDNIDEMDLVWGPGTVNTGYDDINEVWIWTPIEIDLEDYLGKEIYIAFHHEDYDEYEIWIDAVEIYGESSEAEPEELTVNEGQETNGYVPVYGFYEDAYVKSQILYTSDILADLEPGSIIKELTFYSSAENVSWGNAQLEVYMGTTEGDTLTDFVDWSSMTKVMNAASLSIVDGEMHVVFDTPYVYLGGNLVMGFINVVTGSYVSSYWYGNNVTGASVMGYSYSSLDGINATQRNFLPMVTFTYIPGGRIVFVTADDLTKSYGAEDPELTATVEGLEEGETANYTLSREPGEDVGEYTIQVKPGRNRDFTLIPTNGKLTIEKAVPELSNLSASDLHEGETLGESVIFGTAINPNNNKNVPGTFAFVESEYVPTQADSETTEFAMTFTPNDTWNYETVETTLTLVVHKPYPVFEAPQALDLFYNGEAQELIIPGTTEQGTFLYSFDGENFFAEVPTATELGTYPVWYMVQGDAEHSDTAPELLVSTINLKIYGTDADSPMIAFYEDGQYVYRYDVRISNIPEAFEVYAAQVFMSYDKDALTLKRVEPGDIEWTYSDADNKLMFAWADDEPITLENDQVLFSLVFISNIETGTETVLPFIANSLGLTSAVTVLEDGKTADIMAVTVDGCIRMLAPVWGDANGDGIVTAADAALILRALVGLAELNPAGAFNADVNEDGVVDAEDAVAILRYVVGLIETLPLGQD